jgi:hypothetical protein
MGSCRVDPTQVEQEKEERLTSFCSQNGTRNYHIMKHPLYSEASFLLQ